MYAGTLDTLGYYQYTLIFFDAWQFLLWVLLFFFFQSDMTIVPNFQLAVICLLYLFVYLFIFNHFVYCRSKCERKLMDHKDMLNSYKVLLCRGRMTHNGREPGIAIYFHSSRYINNKPPLCSQSITSYPVAQMEKEGQSFITHRL